MPRPTAKRSPRGSECARSAPRHLNQSLLRADASETFRWTTQLIISNLHARHLNFLLPRSIPLAKQLRVPLCPPWLIFPRSLNIEPSTLDNAVMTHLKPRLLALVLIANFRRSHLLH